MEDRPTSHLADAIAQCCHESFRRLPKHGKPTRKHNGQLEWTVIAAIVMATPKQTLASSGTPVGVEIDDRDDLWDLDCLSLATGSKCLPRGKQSPFGDRLNDCHAEVLARRGFNLWCLTQMQACLDTPGSDANPFVFVPHEPGTDPSTIRSSPPAPFKLRNNQARFYLYVSQAPCGDATTETLAQIQTEESKAAFYSGRQETTTSTASSATTAITMEAAQGPAASVHAGSKHNLVDKSENLHRPKITKTGLDVSTTTLTPTAIMPTQATSSNSHSPTEQGSLSSMVQDLDLLTSKDGVPGKSLAFRRGRVDYDCLTALRTKPGRVDSEPTLSMSCSDKMARWTVLGLTSAVVASLLDQPIYLDAVVTHELFDAPALRRALYQRLETSESQIIASDKENVYELHRPKVWYTQLVFEYSKEVITCQAEQEALLSLKDSSDMAPPLSSSSSSISCSSSSSSTLPPPASSNKALPVASPNGMSWTSGLPVEVIVNGCKAGASAKQKNGQPLPVKSRSRLCKSQLYRTGVQLWEKVEEHRARYGGAGNEKESEDGERVLLKGGHGKLSYRAWKQLIAPKYQQAKAQLLDGVLKHWVRGLPELEQFDVDCNIVTSNSEIV